MRVIRRTVSALAVMVAFNGFIYLNPNGLSLKVLSMICGFFLVFPIDRVRMLWLYLQDKRPQPRIWPTVVLADPRDGYPEGEDWRLIGVVQERR